MVTLKESLGTIINNMAAEEKGLLWVTLTYGEKAEKEASEIISSPEKLRAKGQNVNIDWVVEKLNSAFAEGFVIGDIFKGIYDNYGKQLDIIIKEIFVKALKTQKPIFSQSQETSTGVIQRERWIVEKLIDMIIVNMDEDSRKEFLKNVEELLKEKGMDGKNAATAATALFTGGFTAARAVMGFQFHILVAVVSNAIIRTLTGRGLTFAANAMLQRSIAWIFGPIGWIITIASLADLLVSLINQREYDKYLPAIFIIGSSRMRHELPEYC